MNNNMPNFVDLSDEETEEMTVTTIPQAPSPPKINSNLSTFTNLFETLTKEEQEFVMGKFAEKLQYKQLRSHYDKIHQELKKKSKQMKDTFSIGDCVKWKYPPESEQWQYGTVVKKGPKNVIVQRENGKIRVSPHLLIKSFSK